MIFNTIPKMSNGKPQIHCFVPGCKQCKTKSPHLLSHPLLSHPLLSQQPLRSYPLSSNVQIPTSSTDVKARMSADVEARMSKLVSVIPRAVGTTLLCNGGPMRPRYQARPLLPRELPYSKAASHDVGTKSSSEFDVNDLDARVRKLEQLNAWIHTVRVQSEYFETLCKCLKSDDLQYFSRALNCRDIAYPVFAPIVEKAALCNKPNHLRTLYDLIRKLKTPVWNVTKEHGCLMQVMMLNHVEVLQVMLCNMTYDFTVGLYETLVSTGMEYNRVECLNVVFQRKSGTYGVSEQVLRWIVQNNHVVLMKTVLPQCRDIAFNGGELLETAMNNRCQDMIDILQNTQCFTLPSPQHDSPAPDPPAKAE